MVATGAEVSSHLATRVMMTMMTVIAIIIDVMVN